MVPAEDAGPNLTASNQGQEAYAPEAAAPHDPDWQQLEGLQQHSLTEEAREPVEADEPDAEHVYAAPEDQQFQGERPGDAEAEQSATKPGTAAYYDAHRHDELYAGAQLTVEQMCYLMLSQKQTHRQHDTAFDEQCRLHRDVLLPKPNKMPGSLYLMRKVRKSLLTLRGLRATTCNMHSHLFCFVLVLSSRGGMQGPWVTSRTGKLPREAVLVRPF